jgi:N-acetylneuraminic acid mutarotase
MKTRLLLSVMFIPILIIGLQAQDTWTQKANYSGGNRTGSIGFSIGTKGYAGLGFDDAGLCHSDFWEYDPATDVWTQKADFGAGVRGYATGFNIGNKGYVGTGIVASYNWRKDFWEYDPVANTWTQKADFAGGLRYTAIGFSIGDKGYMGTGNYRSSPYVNATYYNDFWEYNPITDLWTQKASVPNVRTSPFEAPKGRANATGISIGNKGYVGLGFHYYDTRLKDWWEYDPVANAWIRKADFGGTQRYGASGFSIGIRGYVGGGGYYSIFNDLWEFNSLTNIWTQRLSVPGVGRFMPVTFAIGSKGYFGLGTSDSGLSDFYQYSPYTVTFSCPSDTTVSNDGLKCDAVVTNIDPVITVSPSIASFDLNYVLSYNGQIYESGSGSVSGKTFQKGVTTVTYSIYTPNEPIRQCQFTTTVQDITPPTIIECAETYTYCFDNSNNYDIPLLIASDNCGIERISFSITGATIRTGTGNNASGNFEIGTSTIEWSIQDSSGNTSSCTTSVLVNFPISVSIPDTYAVNPGGEPNTIYIGYGPISLIYQALVSGGTPFEGGSYNYLWSTGETTVNNTINPGIEGQYEYSIEASDALGCHATKAILVTVLDVRCGKNLDKVELCKTPPGNPDKTQVVCINRADVANQLKNGSHLSVCSPFGTYDLTSDGYITIFPNPNKGAFAIQLMNPNELGCEIKILNRDGKEIDSKVLNSLTDQQPIPFDLSGQPSGMYYLTIVTEEGAKIYKILKD